MKLAPQTGITIVIAIFVATFAFVLTLDAPPTPVFVVGLLFVAVGVIFLRFRATIAPAMYKLQVPAYRKYVSEQKFMDQLIMFGTGAAITGSLIIVGIPFRSLSTSARADIEQRARRHFAIPDALAVDSVTIRAAILRSLPINSSETSIYAYLEGAGFSRNDNRALSPYFPRDADNRIGCRVAFDPNSLGLVKEHYGVVFQLSDDGLLDDIAVHAWLTGL